MSTWNGFEHLVREQEPLAMHTWLQLGGPAEFFAEPQTVDELVGLVQRCHETGTPIRVLGRGSNVLIRDEGVPGLVLRLSAPDFCRVSVADNRLTAGGGARLGRVVTTAVHAGLGGIEVLIAIPGTFGGALHGNAGAHGGDIGQWVASAEVLTYDGQVCSRDRDELVFGYRQSSLDDLVILSAVLELDP
ncbi:MAG: FAD-binding protein, partial [Planctomycetota bacterium]